MAAATVDPATTAAEPTSTGDQHRPWFPRGRAAVLLALLAALFLASGLYQAAHDAPTVDEGVDVSSGVTGLLRRDQRLVPEHPALPKAVAALPALAADPVVPDTPAYRSGDWFDYSDDFISANREAGRLRELLFLARLVPLLEGLGCGLLIYVLASRLFGVAAGTLAAGLWLTTPVIVGLSHFAMMDVPFTMATLAFSLAMLWFLEDPGDRRAAVVGASVGVAIATRHTALALLVIAVVLVVAPSADRRQAVRAVVLVVLVTFGSLWGIYRVLGAPPSGPVAERFDGIQAEAAEQSAVAKVAELLPAPEEWKAGFGYLVLTSDARPVYLLGQAWEGGRPWFFLGSLAVKVPIGLLAVVVAGPFWWRGLDWDRRRLALCAVVAPGVLLFLLMLAQPLNLGLRLVLPSLALALVAASPIARIASKRWGQVVLGLVAGGQLLALSTSHPHSLAWTPAPFRPAYQWASDSNLDFGQDLFGLESWSRRPGHEEPWVSVATTRGLGPPRGSRQLVGADPADVTGWVAVGATSLTQLHRDELAWLRAYCPVGTIGGSILLYRFDRPPSPEPGPTKPVGPCFGEEVSRRS